MSQRIDVAAFDVSHRELSLELATDLARTRLVTCRPDLASGRFEIAAGSKVGVAVGPGWQLHVHSHLRISDLMFLLSYARDPQGWKAPTANFGETDLFSAVTAGFIRCAQSALRQGVLRGYRGVEERSPVLRGRLQVGAQIARGGLPTPLDIIRDEYDQDVIENRFLTTAARRLLMLRPLPASLVAALRGLLRALDGVSVLSVPHAPALPLRSRLNDHYWPALVLADLVIRNMSVSSSGGSARSATFAFELHKVFEHFLETALRSELGPRGFSVFAQSSDRHLDVEKAIGLRPDIVVAKAGVVRAIVDAKFKHKTWPTSDAYQMLAYLLAFNVRQGFLVSATGASTEHRIESADKAIALRSLALDGGAEVSLGRVRALASEIANGSA